MSKSHPLTPAIDCRVCENFAVGRIGNAPYRFCSYQASLNIQCTNGDKFISSRAVQLYTITEENKGL
jgi:hypothetical protein